MAQTADVPRTRLLPLHMIVMRGASRNTLRRGGSRARLRVESRRVGRPDLPPRSFRGKVSEPRASSRRGQVTVVVTASSEGGPGGA